MANIKELFINEVQSEWLIGCFNRISSKSGILIDIRGEEGEVLDSFILLPVDCEEDLIEGEFYRFKWDVDERASNISQDNTVKLKIIGNVEQIDKNEFLYKLFKAKVNVKGSVREILNKSQENIFKEVTGAEHTYIYELLQNANDYPSPLDDNIVKVKFIVTKHYLVVLHTGEVFNLKNITAICSVNQGEKEKNTKTIGYKGIGFKTVFVNNDYVYLRSGDWKLRFDKQYVESNIGKRAWAFMPIATDDNELDDELKEVLSKEAQHYRVIFALKHKGNDASYNTPLLDKVFSDDQILLFIPNVYEAKIEIRGRRSYSVYKNQERWTLSTYQWQIPEELHKWVVEDIKKGGRVPPKFANIDKISISFAAARDGKKLVPISNARVYNYLPTELKLGFNFLVNSDFIPNGSRNNLHETEWNEHVMEQCGRQFVTWWTSLLSEEDQWDAASVFDLIPEFRSSERYAEIFKRGFMQAMRQSPCIPAKKDGKYQLLKISEIVRDDLGLTSGDSPMFTDDEFYKFTKTEGILPIVSLRKNKVLYSLLRNVFVNTCHKFTGNSLFSLLDNKDFLSWLLVRRNNIKFNKFLLEQEWMMNMTSSKIILTATGKLNSFDKLYMDIDSYIDDLPVLSDLVERIDPEVRNELAKVHQWNNFIGKFRRFNGMRFAEEVKGLYDKNPRLFEKEDYNVGLVNVLSSLEVKASYYIPNNFKFFTTKGELHAINENLFLYSSLGKEFASQHWVKEDWVSFISEKYFNKRGKQVKAFLSELNLKEIKNEVIYYQYLTPDDTANYISNAIKDKKLNVEFYRFLALTLKMDLVTYKITPKMKSKYSLVTTDGAEEHITTMSNQVFFKSEEWEDAIHYDWMPKDISLALSDCYFENLDSDEVKRLENFFRSTNVLPLTSGTLANLICTQKNFDTICSHISDVETSKNFLKFLLDNKKHIFKDGRFSPTIKGIPILLDGADQLVPLSSITKCYYHNYDLDDLLSQSWGRDLTINICSEKYNDLFAKQDDRKFFESFGICEFQLITYLHHHVLCAPDKIRPLIQSKKANLEFHRFLYKYHQKLSGEDIEKIKRFPIYISSPKVEEGVLGDVSDNHNLPSPMLTEIVRKDIVPVFLLDCIHPDYITSKDEAGYYCECLDNRELNRETFVEYITSKSISQGVESYLRDVNRNIRFWRWVCDAKLSFKNVEQLSIFPMLGYDNSKVDEFMLPNDLFISNNYSEGSNIESFISEYIKNPHFVSSCYIEKEDGRNWVSLFRALHVTVETSGFVFKYVMPRLTNYKGTDIVDLLAEHYEKITERLKNEKNQTIVEQLSKLNLKCIDGIYRHPSDSILTGLYFDMERMPFVGLELNNFVSDEYIVRDDIGIDKSKRVKRLLIAIFDKLGNSYENPTKVRDAKIRYFIQNQNKFEGEAHIDVIKELAVEFARDRVGIQNLLEEEGKDIFLYDTDSEKLHPLNLYFSSPYGPECDFMANGITAIAFVSDKYLQADNHKIIKDLFSQIGVNGSFSANDLPLLSNERFSRYFWEDYASSREELSSICTCENMKTIACIPSPLGNKRPGDLYDYRNNLLQKMVLSLPDGQNMLPNVNLPKWVKQIGLRDKLYLSDCLEYLKLDKENNRKYVLRWITETPEEIISRNKTAIQAYIKEANWLNEKKAWVPLSSLVALEYNNKTLKNNFSNNAFVCLPSSMPESQTDFNKLCSILSIRVIKNEDFCKVQSGKCYDDLEAKTEIGKRLKYLAYKSEKNNWKDISQEYEQKLSKCSICSCERIDYRYDDHISTEIMSYTDEDTKLWYVGSWNGSMFLDILNWVVRVFNIKECVPDDSYLKKLFMRPFKDFLLEHEYDLSPEFLDCLSEEDREGLLADTGSDEEEFDENDFSASLRDDLNHESIHAELHVEEQPATFSPASMSATAKTDPFIQSDANQEQRQQPEVTPSEDKESHDDYDTNVADIHERKTRSDKGGHHNAYQRSSTNSSKFESWEENLAKDTDQNSTHDLESKLRSKWEKRANSSVKRPSLNYSDDEPYVISNQSSPVSNGKGSVFDENYKDMSAYRTDNSQTKAKSSLKRKNTEAHNNAEHAEEQLKISDLRDKTPEYTFLWFKYTMELMYEDRAQANLRSAQIDFFSKEFTNNGTVIHLYNPSTVVPLWVENSDKIQVYAYHKGTGCKVNASIIKVDEVSVDLMLEDEKKVPTYRDASMFRLTAENNMSIINSLQTRFLQLGYEDDYNLKDNLPENIRFIYGPPGTGKTMRLVSEIHNIIANPSRKTNILVLTPTNKAADVITKRLADDDVCYSYLSRYGSTEDPTIIEEAILTTRDNMDMDAFDHNIIVTTVARYAYDTVKPDDKFICDYSWDYIVVDEASMIDIVNITFILHKAKKSSFIIAGDPKQIQPISQNGYGTENIYVMVGINELKTTINSYKRYPVIPLLTQYRSVPVIGNLVSNFAYNGLIQPYTERVPQKPLELKGIPLNTINFLGFEVHEFDNLYGLAAINDSAFHLYSAIFTYNMVRYVASQITNKYPYQDYSIGIVCPYGAEAHAIKQMIEERPISQDNCNVCCGTVHSFQGDECDIMFVVMNPPVKVSEGTHINNENIINVALSRARDYLFIVAPEGLKSPLRIMNKIGSLINNKNRSAMHCRDLEKVIFGESDYILNNTVITCHMPVNVYYESAAEYEVRIDEHAMDIQINDRIDIK